MDYTPLSPFKRPLTCAHLQEAARGAQPPALPDIDKWALFRELTTARDAFGVSSRELTVLQALLSFHPAATLGAGTAVVFPSNRALCERLNGMACSTMRRHLARLIDSGLIARRDSPNGKRYMRRDDPTRTGFGFDLAPLHRRAPDILAAADAARAEARHLRKERETVSLMRRDLAALIDLARAERCAVPLEAAERVPQAAQMLRRKLAIADLEQLQRDIEDAIAQVQACLAPALAEEPVTADSQNEQHQHKTEIKDSVSVRTERHRSQQSIGLADLTQACPSLRTFCTDPIRNWPDLHRAVSDLRSAMGIDAAVWAEAQEKLGVRDACIAVVSMLERFSDIRSPGAYLRALGQRAVEGRFDGAGMMAGLARRQRAA